MTTPSQSYGDLLLFDELMRRLARLEAAPTTAVARDETLEARQSRVEARVDEVEKMRNIDLEVKSRLLGVESRLDELTELENRLERSHRQVSDALDEHRQLLREVRAASATVMETVTRGKVTRRVVVVRDASGNITGTVESQ